MTTSVQAVHCFEVTSFSLLQGMGQVRELQDLPRRRPWLEHHHGLPRRVEAKEKKENKAAYVSVFLYFADGAEDARTNFTLELLEKERWQSIRTNQQRR